MKSKYWLNKPRPTLIELKENSIVCVINKDYRHLSSKSRYIILGMTIIRPSIWQITSLRNISSGFDIDPYPLYITESCRIIDPTLQDGEYQFYPVGYPILKYKIGEQLKLFE